MWVEDQDTGAPLLAAGTVTTDGHAHTRVRTVAWLLDEPAHRDVPELILGSLRWLAGIPRKVHAAVGEPVDLRLEVDSTARVDSPADAGQAAAQRVARFALMPTNAALELTPERAGTHVVAGEHLTRTAVAFASVAPAPATDTPPPELEALGGGGHLLPWLLALALALLLLDAWLYHRGRLP